MKYFSLLYSTTGRVFFGFLLSFLFIFNNVVYGKILVITHSFNRPDFIEIQDKTFKKFLEDDYTFVVFNDAKTSEISNQITKICKELDISCIRIPQSIHAAPYLPRSPGEDYNHPAIRCANVVQYSLDILGFDYDGIVMIIDSDMFLIDNFSVEKYLGEYDLAGVPHSRGHVEYLWNGLMFFNMKNLPDKNNFSVNCGKIDNFGVDVGGQIYNYLKTHPEVKVKFVDAEHIGENYVLTEAEKSSYSFQYLFSQKPNNIEFLIFRTFFHYRGGGNWDNKSKEYHKKKTSILNGFIDLLLQEKSS